MAERVLMNLESRLMNETSEYLIKKINRVPDVLMILGSGLGNFADNIDNPIVIPYKKIPNFEVSTVTGHAGQLVVGYVGDKYVAVMQGRVHFYEGYPMNKVAFPVKVFAKMGTKTLIATNAAGIVNENFKPTELMVLTDHINLMFNNPLIGVNNDELGPRFPDMSEVYTKSLRDLAEQVAGRLDVPLHKGVYMAMCGPSYETPAEVRMARILGADAVGMSTVPETIVARHAGMKCLGISCLTNYAAGISNEELNHEEVMANSKVANEYFRNLLYNIIVEM